MNSTLAVLNQAGQPAGEVTLNPAWLEEVKGDQAVKDTVVAHLAARRAGTAAVKNRKIVRGGGRKPWRQKGTGRARCGSIRSPLWRGGGVIFGPQPRKYGFKLNVKVKQLALRRAFTERLKEGAVTVVADVSVSAGKTKELATLLKTLKLGDSVLVMVTGPVDRKLALASRNLPDVQVSDVSHVNTYELLLFRKLLLTQAALQALGQRLA